MCKEEIWADIAGFDGKYQISTEGWKDVWELWEKLEEESEE